MTIAVFDYATWAAMYPELLPRCTQPVATAYFAQAGLLCDNTDGAVIPADGTTYEPRLTLLGLVTAHLAALSPANVSRQGLVGRISSASQGSVSISATMEGAAGNAAFWNQTTYGATYWQMTAGYRTMRVASYRQFPGRAFPWLR